MSSTSKPEAAVAAVHGTESFPSSARIRKRPDFLRVQETGRRVHTPSFVIMVLPAPTQRVGITVTRRNANAVGRNRIKRVVREVFRRNRALFPATGDVVFIARASTAGLDYARVQREVSAASAALARAAGVNASRAASNFVPSREPSP